MPMHQIPQISLIQHNQSPQTKPILQLTIKNRLEISIVQPIVQALFQAAQLAQERIILKQEQKLILKQEQKLILSTPPMNLMTQLPLKIVNKIQWPKLTEAQIRKNAVLEQKKWKNNNKQKNQKSKLLIENQSQIKLRLKLDQFQIFVQYAGRYSQPKEL
ncbi:unnamed protein product [Paramecium primaurelia]|uniref:Uncharacterized protein n=1 Tax=Paramecium primaurelia TaxID=5886 RepID=A0A8S1NDW9_PARPR|nr:unnamed protein product [Paramecium primaurelia]